MQSHYPVPDRRLLLFMKMDTDMDNNYLLQYDRVVAFLEHLLSFWAGILRRYPLTMLKSPFKLYKQTRTMMKQGNLLSSRLPDSFRNLIAGIATTEQKQNPYFPIFMSEYTLDALALAVLREFPDVDYEKLMKIHELKLAQLTRTLGLEQTAGIIFTVGTLLLRSIPESVVERVIDYAYFERFVFLATVITLGILFLSFLPALFRVAYAKRTLGLIGDVLTYITIRQEGTNK
jgi:hypothetical protein